MSARLPRHLDGVLTLEASADADEMIGRKLDAILAEFRDEYGMSDVEIWSHLTRLALIREGTARRAAWGEP